MIDVNRFETADPEDLYARMRPDQRTAVANEFVRSLTLAGDPKVDELCREDTDTAARKARGAARGTEAPGTPQMLTPQEVERIHAYACDHRREVFEEVLRHPVTQAALAHAGEAPSETDEGLDASALKLTVDVPSSLDKAAIFPMLKP
jgi:hypothetical protein